MAHMTCEEIALQALARAYEVTQTVPSVRSVMYRRIGVRQQMIMLAAAKTNPDFYGTSATGDLDDGALDFADLEDTEGAGIPSAIAKVTIADPGTSDWAANTEVVVVAETDIAAAIPPRATVRDRVLRGVEDELDGVTSLTIFYAREGPVYDGTSRDVAVELANPWSELLVMDLARMLIAKSPASQSPQGAIVLKALDDEEQGMMADFLAYVSDYAPMVERFASAAQATKPGPS